MKRTRIRAGNVKSDQKRTSYEIVATNFRMLGSKSDSAGSGYRSSSPAAGSADFDSDVSSHTPADHDQAGPEVTDEDIPF
jgi:single-stranded DNA-binding protein